LSEESEKAANLPTQTIREHKPWCRTEDEHNDEEQVQRLEKVGVGMVKAIKRIMYILAYFNL
jgi:hypothetical protein